MKFAGSIRIIIVLILGLSFINQYNSHVSDLSINPMGMAGQPAAQGNFESHELSDGQHCDDIIHEVHEISSNPEFVLKESFRIPVPEPVLADPSPCWQPPDFRS
jgi:hypothetical protein